MEEVEEQVLPRDNKTAERDNRINCQQVYTSSPIKPNENIDDPSGNSIVRKFFNCVGIL